MKYFISMVTLFFNLLLGCESEAIVDTGLNKTANKELVEVHFDLQTGFAGKHALVSINNKIYYNSILSETVSLAGPEASFTTYLPDGSNTITVFTRTLNEQSVFNDSSRIFLGEKEKYYIGLQIYDSLSCVVQDSIFLYL